MIINLRLTATSISTELRPGDVFVGEDLAPVKSARLTRDGFNNAMVYFMDGTRDVFGLPQSIEVERKSCDSAADETHVV